MINVDVVVKNTEGSNGTVSLFPSLKKEENLQRILMVSEDFPGNTKQFILIHTILF